MHYGGMLTGAQIKKVREEDLKESQAQFAKRFGVAQTTVHRWEENGPPERGAAGLALERVLEDLKPKPGPAS